MSNVIETTIYKRTVGVSGAPSSVEEYDKMSSPGGCLAAAVDRDIQHIWKGNFRKNLSAELNKLGGEYSRILDENKKPTENDQPYFDRCVALATQGTEGRSMDDIEAAWALAIANTEYKCSGAPGTSVGKTWLEDADGFLEQNLDAAAWNNFTARITVANPSFTFSFQENGSTPTRESLALALKTEDARVRRESTQNLFAAE